MVNHFVKNYSMNSLKMMVTSGILFEIVGLSESLQLGAFEMAVNLVDTADLNVLWLLKLRLVVANLAFAADLIGLVRYKLDLAQSYLLVQGNQQKFLHWGNAAAGFLQALVGQYAQQIERLLAPFPVKMELGQIHAVPATP